MRTGPRSSAPTTITRGSALPARCSWSTVATRGTSRSGGTSAPSRGAGAWPRRADAVEAYAERLGVVDLDIEALSVEELTD